MIGVPGGGMCGGIRRALVLGLVLITETAIEQAPAVGPLSSAVRCILAFLWAEDRKQLRDSRRFVACI